jgi:heat shock protein HslJ
LPDVPVTAQFENGEITGNAGCNNYFGGYQADGDAITIGPLGATRAFCVSIQDQEDRYLALLQTATSYAIDGSTLTLSEGGTTLLEFDG